MGESTRQHSDLGSARIDRLHFLRDLYAAQVALTANPYLAGHAEEHFLRGTEQVFEWYRRYLTPGSRILDWGCRHAPDACLLVYSIDGAIEIEGCDVVDPADYGVFHDAAGLAYTRLTHEYKLPYDDASFDGVIASGVLEHVPMEYESLRELSRVCRENAILVITYLPNAWSLHEFRARRSARDLTRAGDTHHLRTYRLRRVRELLMSVGFVPLEIGYQTHFDLLPLPAEAGRRVRLLSWVGRRMGVARVAPCLAIVARRMSYF